MAISNSILIPVEEYLSTVYEPDVDYLEGQLELSDCAGLPGL